VKDCGEIIVCVSCCVLYREFHVSLLLGIGRSLPVVLCVRYVTLTVRIALDLQTFFIRIFILRVLKLQSLFFTNGNDLCKPIVYTRCFNKSFYKFESLCTFIQRTYRVFSTVIIFLNSFISNQNYLDSIN
jgi:hypothetical protein